MSTQQENNEEIYFSDLEEQLVNDDDGKFRDHLMSQLFNKMIELKSLRDQGVIPAEHERIEALILTLSAAGETVAKTWSKHHKQVANSDV